MGFLGLFKGKDKGEDGAENELLLDFKTQEKGNAEELTQLLNGKLLPEKPHGRSYVEEKIKQLQEQALLRKYEQDFVPSYNFEEEGFLQKLKSEIENMWRNFFIALIFFTRDFNLVEDGGEEVITDEQIIERVERLAPGLTKTVAQNLLKKMEAQKELLDHTEMSDSDALIGSLAIEAKSKQQALDLLISTDLCHPRDLDVDFKDPLWTEYAIYRKNLQDKKQKYEALIAIYASYTESTKSIFEKRDELSVTTEDRVNSSMRLNFSPKHLKNSLPYKLEEQQLSKDIEEACIPIQEKRKELESEIEKSKRDRIVSALNMFDLQRKRLPMGSYAHTQSTPGIHEGIRGNKELINAMRNKDKNPIEYWYVQKDPSISIAGHQNFQVYKVLVNAYDYTLSINPISEDVFLVNCEKLSKMQRQYLIEIFSDETKEVQVSSLSLPQGVNAYQENWLKYIRLGSSSTGEGLYFTDGKVLDKYSLKKRLDKWIEQYVSYEKAPNGLGGYIVSIHHPELPVQYYYEPTAEDFDKLVGSTEETTASIIKSVDSNSMRYRMKSIQSKPSISRVREMPRTVRNDKKNRDENYTKLFFEALQKLEISITLGSRSMDEGLMYILAKDLGFEDVSDSDLFTIKTASLMYVRNQGGGTYLYDSSGDDSSNAIQLEMYIEGRRYAKVNIGPGVDETVKILFQR